MDSLFSFLSARTASARRDLAILAATFGIFCFQFLGKFPLMEPDEGRYSEIPREMLERMDFITPTLNYVKYFEKPPLLYWLNALSFSLFGQNEFAARLPCACAGLLTILAIYWLGRELFGRRTGLLAAVVLGSSAGFIPQARIPLTDMPLTLCLTLCLGAFILAVRDNGPRKGLYYYLFYGSAALAVLAKGLIGIVFPGAIIFLFMLVRKRWNLLREMRLPTGIPLFLLIAAPWFILVSLRNPEFARFFFIHEHFERFLTKVHQRYQPVWFFIPVLAGTMLPWSFFLPVALRQAWRERRGERGDTLAWLAIWAGFIFLFFSKSSSKLVPYILPVFPPLALLIACAVESTMERGLASLRSTILAVSALLLVLAGGLPLYATLSPKGDIGIAPALAVAFILLVTVTGVLKALKGNNLPVLITSLALGMTIFTAGLSSVVYANLAEKKSLKTLALKVRELVGPETVVASFGYNQTLPFYTARRTVVVGDRSELDFGSKQGDQSAWFIPHADFYAIWDGEKPVLTILGKGEVATLAANVKKQPRIILENRRRALVANF